MKKGLLALLLALSQVVPVVCAPRTISLNSLDGGAEWELFRQADVLGVSGKRISVPGYHYSNAVPGIVPGTTFAAYVAAGREENPEYGDNIYLVDETYYNRPFWYRTEFDTPVIDEGERVWLHFDNTHRYADFYFNGVKLSGSASSTRDVKGHMVRSRYDVTELLASDGRNAVAVLITDPTTKKRRDSSDAYGITCSPSYMSAAGWDWMPYVPGRLSGITGNAYLKITGSTVMEDPWVRSSLTDDGAGEIAVRVDLRNASEDARKVTLRGTITPGDIEFSKEVTVDANGQVRMALDKNDFAQLRIESPRLWWPNGYGEPDMYTCRLECLADGTVSDVREVNFGIRKYEYEKVTNSEGYPVWRFKVNGQLVYLKGGNWGISEYLLRCHGDEYGKKIMLHKDMNYNMIRLWTGCVTDEEFYDWCDRAGIMVWDDFWLYVAFNGVAEPDAFKQNAREKVVRLRNHPCIALWCGANETHPADELDAYLKELVETEDGNDRMYKSCSNDDGLSGSGWWSTQTPDRYFDSASNAMAFSGYRFTQTSGYGLRSEIGMATFPNYESVELFIPEDSRWPLPDDNTLENVDNTVWNHHFYGKEGWNASPKDYRSMVNSQYGTSGNLEDFCMKAQMLNLESMRGMYEAWNDKLWNDATGLLLWMSNPAYPSFLWQTYDYYYDATGAYWGAKKGCEHLHVQWNSKNGSVKVINTSGSNLNNATVEAKVYNVSGTELEKCAQSVGISVAPSDKKEAFVLSTDGGVPKGIRFVRLMLKDASGNVLSENRYWYNTASNYDYKALAALPQAQISCEVEDAGDGRYDVTVTNGSPTVAFGVRLRMVNPITGERVLPLLMDDNFLTLMPNERRRITVDAPVQELTDGADLLVKQFLYPEFKVASADGSAVESVYADGACDLTVVDIGGGNITVGWGGSAPRHVTVMHPNGTVVLDRVLNPMESVHVGTSGLYIVSAGIAVRKIVVH